MLFKATQFVEMDTDAPMEFEMHLRRHKRTQSSPEPHSVSGEKKYPNSSSFPLISCWCFPLAKLTQNAGNERDRVTQFMRASLAS